MYTVRFWKYEKWEEMNSVLLEITCIAHHYGTACTQGMAVWSKYFSHFLTFFKCEGNHRVDIYRRSSFTIELKFSQMVFHLFWNSSFSPLLLRWPPFFTFNFQRMIKTLGSTFRVKSDNLISAIYTRQIIWECELGHCTSSDNVNLKQCSLVG